jgi:parallel beta-helix repeat protein
MPAFFLTTILLIICSATVHARVIHVPGDSTTIQRGINGAVNGDTVMVHPGTYNERYINFKGKAITVMSTNPLDSVIVAATIVDGRGSGDLFLFKSGEKETSVLTGFTIRNGHNKYEGSGAITCEGSSPTISHNIITDNNGYGIYCENSSPRILENWIVRNRTSYPEWYMGGGIFLYVSHPIIAYNTIRENQGVLHGGGIRASSSSPNIISNRIIENSASFSGGGIYFSGSSPYIFGNVIARNEVSRATTNGEGGGIYYYGGRNGIPIITNNLIIDNLASHQWYTGRGGGIVCISEIAAILSNNIITGNTAVSGYNNYASLGGGLFLSSPQSVLWNNTITSNTSDWGSGLFVSLPYSRGLRGSKLTIHNSIIWDNQTQDWGQIYFRDTPNISIMELRYSDVEGGEASIHVPDGCILLWGPGMVETDPLFEDSVYHLSFGSPCIDAGDPEVLDLCRPPGLGEERSDMGAYGGENNCDTVKENGTVGLWIFPSGSVKVPCGGKQELTSVLRNNSPEQKTIELWFMRLTPDSSEFLIPVRFLNVANPSSMTLDPLSTISLVSEVFIPTYVDTGIYSLIARVGSYPDSAIDQARLDLEVYQPQVIKIPGDYLSIQEGIDAALHGDTVLVSPGIYSGYGNRDITFRGKRIVVMSEMGPEHTIIDCGGSPGDPHNGFRFETGEDRNTVLSGFTIRNAYAIGGGIVCYDSSPTISNNIITRNGGSGILCSSYSSPVIINNVISYNYGNYGGAIRFSYKGPPILINNTIVGNSADEIGGALYGYGYSFLPCSLTVVNTIFLENTSPNGPDIGISGYGCVTIRYCNFPGGPDSIFVDDNATYNWGPGNIDVDPLFLLSDRGDYRLLPGSPCIDAGTPGLLDPDRSRSDMGAFYFDPHEQITLYLTPDTTGITSGDSLGVTYTLVNRWSYSESFDLKSDIILSDGRQMTIFGPEPYTLEGGETLQFYVRHGIPKIAPIGYHEYKSQTIHPLIRVPGEDSFIFRIGE